MAVKKEEKKNIKQEKNIKTEEKSDTKKDASSSERYFYGVGRRKAAVSQVRLYESAEGSNELIVNGKKMKKYFPHASFQDIFLSPLKSTGLNNKFRISVVVRGGGSNGQAEASRLGISRALVKFDEGLRKILRSEGFLTRDSRVVERKKPGLKKARRSPQWAKR